MTNPTTATTVYDTVGLPMGMIMGRVQVVDTSDRPIDPTGVTATIEGTSIHAVTDSNGVFMAAKVPAGTYNLMIAKPGFGTCRIFGVTALGPASTIIPAMRLGQSFSATLRLDSVMGGDTVNQYFTMLGTSTIRSGAGVVVFLDLDSTVPLDHKHWAQFTGFVQSGLSIVATHSSPLAALPAGTKLYASAAFYNANSTSVVDPREQPTGYYYDPIEDANRYISLGPRSNVLTLVVR